MMNNKGIRRPKQKRAIQKKERIIDAGFELICKYGYYNTNAAKIAKEAGVSTGIVYQYFKDKHDIFIEAIKKYGDNVFFPMLNVKSEDFEKSNFKTAMRKLIDQYIKNHKVSKIAHKEIMSMVHSDPDIAKYYYERELASTERIRELLLENHFNNQNLYEKVHIMIGMIDNLCHEIIYHRHRSMDYNAMIDIVINNIVELLA